MTSQREAEDADQMEQGRSIYRRRAAALTEMAGESAVAKKSDQETLHLEEWTKSANKRATRRQMSAHSYSTICCSTGKMTFEWTEHLVYGAFALLWQIIFGHAWAFPDGLDTTGAACGDFRYNNATLCQLYQADCGGAIPPDYCANWHQEQDPCGGFTPNAAYCGLGPSIAWAREQFKFLTPFILGGFVVSTVMLWRTRRTAYCMLCGAVRNMNINLASILPLPADCDKNKFQEKQIVHARTTLARWSLLGFELSILKARGLIDVKEVAVPHLERLGLLKEGEWDAMVPGDRHTTAWYWMQTMVMQLVNQGIINPHIHAQTLCHCTTLIRDKANDLMSALDRDQPFPYAFITGILVNCTLLMDALYSGNMWAVKLFEQGIALYAKPAMWFDLLLLVLTCMLFGMLYDLQHILYNPFGARTIDLPHTAVGGGIRKMARSFATGHFLPPTLGLPEPVSPESPKDDASETEDWDFSDESDPIIQEYLLATRDTLVSRNTRGSIFSMVSKRW